ncbi:hypothetical protein BZA05DRAFT_385349 [Tricharina praecox]|uniref:uncharacterized protein n=1 Tax=Tricharina praecox TaxID=43433 RepID=UPI00221E9A3E|nr:uncharacterized protein BZA05DRAFT_385349 [Tricharina praecox]KAI5857947.1 hypothetical protein BZA05DRAFT_385349 [Tricharina praecox]
MATLPWRSWPRQSLVVFFAILRLRGKQGSALGSGNHCCGWTSREVLPTYGEWRVATFCGWLVGSMDMAIGR